MQKHEVLDLKMLSVVTLLISWSFRVIWEDSESVPGQGRSRKWLDQRVKPLKGKWDGPGKLLEYLF